MFGAIGVPEIMILLLLVLILFGPKQIPELARGIGKGLNELKRATNEVKQEFKLDDFDKPSKPDF